MAAADASKWSVKGQAFRLTNVVFGSNSKPYSNAGTLSATISKDGGAFAATSGTPTEIGTSGVFFLDLTAAEMNANTIVVLFASTDEDARIAPWVEVPLDLSEPAAHWRDASVLRLEQGLQHPIIEVANGERYRYSDARLSALAYGGASTLYTRSFSVAEDVDAPYEQRSEI